MSVDKETDDQKRIKLLKDIQTNHVNRNKDGFAVESQHSPKSDGGMLDTLMDETLVRGLINKRGRQGDMPEIFN
jgi:hypothetical protein